MKNIFIKIKQNKGITLLLVIVILSALLTVGIGIFNVVFGEILISGEITDSYVAFYAADRAIDKFLYADRNGGGLNDSVREDTTNTSSTNGCYIIKIFKNTVATPTSVHDNCQNTTANVCIRSIGQSRCNTTSSRLVKRGFMVLY